MKALLISALVGAAVLTPQPPEPAAHPGYSGVWLLDVQRSKDLPSHYERMESHRLTVAQSDSQLVVDVESRAGQSTPDRTTFVYPLDGRETTTTTRVRTPDRTLMVPTRLKATRGARGALHITVTRELQTPDGSLSVVGTEEWQLRDERTLVVRRVEQMPGGEERRFEMVFARG